MDFIELYEKYIDSTDYPKLNSGSNTDLADKTRALYKSIIRNTAKHLPSIVTEKSFRSENKTGVLKAWLIDLNSSATLKTYSKGHRQTMISVFENYVNFIVSKKYLKYIES